MQVAGGGNERLAALDGLRGIALGMVLLLHCFFLGPGDGVFHRTAQALIRSGWLGVQIFFVISGYLITGILLRMRGEARYFHDFYIRRALRILPAYYLVLAFIYLVYPLFNEELRAHDLTGSLPYVLLHMQNWGILGGHYTRWAGMGHFWSLGVEEQFYLFWPLLVAFMPATRLLHCCLALFAGAALLRTLLAWQHAPFLTIMMSTFTSLDSLAAGAFIAALAHIESAASARRKRQIDFAGGLAALTLTGLFVQRGGFAGDQSADLVMAIPLVALTSACIIWRMHYGLLPSMALRLLESRPLNWLGRYCYGVYLIHFVIDFQIHGWVRQWSALDGRHDVQVVTAGMLVLAITFSAAWLMFRWLEAPALACAQRLTRRSPAAPRATGLRPSHPAGAA